PPPPVAGASPPVTGAAAEYVDAHNAARGEVGVPPLKWSAFLANASGLYVRLQRDKQNCSFADLSRIEYGANQIWTRGFTPSPTAAVGSWIAEKKFYNYTDNSCQADRRCGVYTQIVWRKTTDLGCAQAVCSNAQQSSLTICMYDPPGNVIGEKPY
ncbi:hypothetical protein M569_02307, partial [Genlisea aurea]